MASAANTPGSIRQSHDLAPMPAGLGTARRHARTTVVSAWRDLPRHPRQGLR